jgi:hypothetical protein
VKEGGFQLTIWSPFFTNRSTREETAIASSTKLADKEIAILSPVARLMKKTAFLNKSRAKI